MSNEVLFEIGVEELPARFIDRAEKELYELTIRWLKEERIEFESAKSYATPRRLAIYIKGIAEKQQTIVEKVRGPKADIAKDDTGNWTKAAIGFCKGQGKTPDDIFIEEIKGIPYTFVEKRIEGKDSFEVLQQYSIIISSLNFPQMMRWGTEKFRFARPIRWLVALFNEKVIPFEVAGVQTSNMTYGHRFLGKETKIDLPANYESLLEQNYVIADKATRRKMIEEQIQTLEETEKFHVQVNSTLLDEVQHLVEYPTVFFGSFERSFLTLPNEVLITTMQEHQRYFPVFSIDEKQLLPYFVSVRNGDAQQIENVIQGNEKVLRARLADARFFYDEDQSYSIDHFMNKLKTVVFQEKLGTVYEKTKRVQIITEQLCNVLNVSKEEMELAKRAASICKFDLVTNMVNEFPELQGVIGEKYARHYNEDEAVAIAIKEHYFPVQANGELPQTTIGSLVSVADKLDTIIGSISVGLTPTGSQDPYSLRRQTIGMLRIVHENNWDIAVEDLIEIGKQLHDTTQFDEQLTTFISDRVAYVLQQQKISPDIVRATLDGKIGVLSYALDKATLLANKRNDDSFKFNQEAFIRVLNLAKTEVNEQIDPSLFQTASEEKLYVQLMSVQEMFTTYDKEHDAQKAFSTLESLAEPIHQFFEHNMVMDKDEQIKNNRLALVTKIAILIKQFANLSLVEWKQHQ